MGPRTKYDDTIYEKVVYSGKVFIYNSVSWNVLFPIVDIIRLLKKNTIIASLHGKGQQIIKTYGPQYNHMMLYYELKNKHNYIEHLKAVKNIFIFSDSDDIIATNLMNTAKKNKINVVCYSNIDSVYHFYDNINNEIFQIAKPEEVIEKMYMLLDFEGVRKIVDLFDDFEIIDLPSICKKNTLEECADFLKNTRDSNLKQKKEREKNNTKIFDPHLNKLKKMEYERLNRNTIYPDSVEELNKIEINKRKSLLSRFFAK